jgi:hypothetical protein
MPSSGITCRTSCTMRCGVSGLRLSPARSAIRARISSRSSRRAPKTSSTLDLIKFDALQASLPASVISRVKMGHFMPGEVRTDQGMLMAAKARTSSGARNSKREELALLKSTLRSSMSYRVLEQRIVFDGAAADTAAQVVEAASAPGTASPPKPSPYPLPLNPPPTRSSGPPQPRAPALQMRESPTPPRRAGC